MPTLRPPHPVNDSDEGAARAGGNEDGHTTTTTSNARNDGDAAGDNSGGAGGASAAQEQQQQQLEADADADADAEPIPVARLVIDHGGNVTADVVAVSSNRGWIEPTSIVPIPPGGSGGSGGSGSGSVGDDRDRDHDRDRDRDRDRDHRGASASTVQDSTAGVQQQQWRRPSGGGWSSISGSGESGASSGIGREDSPGEDDEGRRRMGARRGTGGTRTKSRRRGVALAVGVVVLIPIVVVLTAVTLIRPPSGGGGTGGTNSNVTDSSSPTQPQLMDAPGDYGGGNVSMGSGEPLDMTNQDEQDTVYRYPIDLSGTEESPNLAQLRGVLIQRLNKNDGSYFDTAMTTAALYDRTTPQYRALYWLAKEDGYCQTQLFPLLVVDDELEFQHHHVEDRILQRYSLAVLYFRTSSDGHGGGWDSVGDYLSPNNECEWSTISCRDKCEWEEWLPCDPSTDPLWAVTTLSLEGNNLRGPIPPELFHLTGLVNLQLRNNNLSGPVPSQIVKLVELDRVDLSRNDLTGTLPEEIGTVAASFGWRYILLSGNRLQGSLPSAWPFATHVLHLHGNMLTGTVPVAYTELHQLSLLRIERNFLTGSINFLCDTIAAGVQLFADTSEVECRCCAKIV